MLSLMADKWLKNVEVRCFSRKSCIALICWLVGCNSPRFSDWLFGCFDWLTRFRYWNWAWKASFTIWLCWATSPPICCDMARYWANGPCRISENPCTLMFSFNWTLTMVGLVVVLMLFLSKYERNYYDVVMCKIKKYPILLEVPISDTILQKYWIMDISSWLTEIRAIWKIHFNCILFSFIL